MGVKKLLRSKILGGSRSTSNHVLFDIDEVALGVADANTKESVLAHIANCDDCDVAYLLSQQVVDELSSLIPDLEPPSGFLGKTVAKFGESEGLKNVVTPIERAARRMPVVVEIAAAVLILAIGVAAGISYEYHRTNAPQSVPFAVRGRLLTANLSGPGGVTGEVAITKGQPEILLASLHDVGYKTFLTCELKLANGKTIQVGNYTSADANTVWTSKVPQVASPIFRVAMVSASGQTVASGTFP